MSRYIHYYWIKVPLTITLLLFFVYILFISLLLDKIISKEFLISLICLIIPYCVVNIIVVLLNKFAKNRIIFEQGKICYKNRVFYSDEISIKYFKPAIIDILIFPPLSAYFPILHINANHFYLTFYITKRDMKKIKKLNFEIKEL